MSRTATAPARTAPRARPAERPPLRLVANGPLSAGRLPFALLIGGILATGLIVLLLLHTLAAQDAFRLEAMQHRQGELADLEQQLALTEQQQQAPATLAARARALGMVPAGSIAFVKANKHGKIIGVSQPAVAPLPPPPAPSATPSAKASTKPTDEKSAKPADDSAKTPATRPSHRRAAPTHRG